MRGCGGQKDPLAEAQRLKTQGNGGNLLEHLLPVGTPSPDLELDQ